MFHRIKEITPLDDYKIIVTFCVGVTKIVDCNFIFKINKDFEELKKDDLFKKATLAPKGYGVIWNDHLDLECEDFWFEGEEIKTKFDGLISMSDATDIWGLNESTFRKAISYGKLKNGIDARKYGKQWVLSVESLLKVYGDPSKQNKTEDNN